MSLNIKTVRDGATQIFLTKYMHLDVMNAIDLTAAFH